MEKHYTVPSPTNRKQTPSGLSSTISSPFIDAYENVTKEFDQFYGYISKVMTPRRTQPQTSSSKVHKITPRIRQVLDKRHNINTDSSSLTPLMEQHSLIGSSQDNNYVSDRRHRQQNYPPPRPMTLTPNTSSHSIFLQQEDMDEESDVYFHSPQCTTTMTPTPFFEHSSVKNTENISICPPSPSLVLHNHLLNESRRLERLRRNVLLVQQQTLALSRRDASSTTQQLLDSKGINQSNNILISSSHNHRNNLSRPATLTPARTQRDLLTLSQPSPNLSKNVPEYHQKSSTASHPPTTTISETAYPTSTCPPTMPHSTSLPQPHLSQREEPKQQSQNSLEELLKDIPKARLRSTETVTTPNGSRIKNRFWEEIHGLKSTTLQSSLVDDDPTTLAQRKRKNLDNDDLFWINTVTEQGVGDNDDNQTYQWADRSRRQRHNSNGKDPLTNRLELARSMDNAEQQQTCSPNIQAQQHYPADFFEELSHTLKNKPVMTDNDDNYDTF